METTRQIENYSMTVLLSNDREIKLRVIDNTQEVYECVIQKSDFKTSTIDLSSWLVESRYGLFVNGVIRIGKVPGKIPQIVIRLWHQDSCISFYSQNHLTQDRYKIFPVINNYECSLIHGNDRLILLACNIVTGQKYRKVLNDEDFRAFKELSFKEKFGHISKALLLSATLRNGDENVMIGFQLNYNHVYSTEVLLSKIDVEYHRPIESAVKPSNEPLEKYVTFPVINNYECLLRRDKYLGDRLIVSARHVVTGQKYQKILNGEDFRGLNELSFKEKFDHISKALLLRAYVKISNGYEVLIIGFQLNYNFVYYTEIYLNKMNVEYHRSIDSVTTKPSTESTKMFDYFDSKNKSTLIDNKMLRHILDSKITGLNLHEDYDVLSAVNDLHKIIKDILIELLGGHMLWNDTLQYLYVEKMKLIYEKLLKSIVNRARHANFHGMIIDITDSFRTTLILPPSVQEYLKCTTRVAKSDDLRHVLFLDKYDVTEYEYQMLYDRDYKDSGMIKHKITWVELYKLCQDLSILCQELSIHEDIKGLYEDERLDLSCNEMVIIHLSDKIGRLVNLKNLNLSSNNLTSLSGNIGLLCNLEKLDLCDNKLTKIPKEIGQLKKLKSLNLTDNALKDLPDELVQLKNLKLLRIHGNQIKNISIELIHVISK